MGKKSNLEYLAQNRCLNIVDFSMEDDDHEYDDEEVVVMGSDVGYNDHNNNGYVMCW